MGGCGADLHVLVLEWSHELVERAPLPVLVSMALPAAAPSLLQPLEYCHCRLERVSARCGAYNSAPAPRCACGCARCRPAWRLRLSSDATHSRSNQCCISRVETPLGQRLWLGCGARGCGREVSRVRAAAPCCSAGNAPMPVPGPRTAPPPTRVSPSPRHVARRSLASSAGAHSGGAAAPLCKMADGCDPSRCCSPSHRASARRS